MFSIEIIPISIIFVLHLFNCEGRSVFLAENQYNTTLQVSIKSGIVQGRERRTVEKTVYFSYEGIPFAQPPIHNLRFKDPKPVQSWNGVLDATNLRSSCVQTILRFFQLQIIGVEDCLYLNVYTPLNRKLSTTSPRPVIVWIYGGAFLEGDASLYGPGHLINENLVVVTFNYRIGSLGFLSTGDEASVGNYGLKDQNLVLRWIQKNIHKFGGDPTKVTLSGHSAGGCSVMFHLLSPKSRGLFRQAIAWSGETTSRWAKQQNPKAMAMDLARTLGIDTRNSTEMVEKMRKVPITTLTYAQLMVIIVHGVTLLQNGVAFPPTIEPNHPDAFITEDFIKLLKNGDFARVPLMMGTATMEFGLLAKITNLVQPFLFLFDISPSLVPNGILEDLSFLQRREIGKRIIDEYFESKSFATSTKEEIVELLTDVLFTRPIHTTIRLMSPYIPIYFWVSAHAETLIKDFMEVLNYPVDKTLKGVVHGEDITYIWYYQHFGNPPETRRIQQKFTKMWANFATTGDILQRLEGNGKMSLLSHTGS